MTPYYEEAGIVIYHGDCRDVLASELGLRVGVATFDLLLTDPPYGIGEAAKKHTSRGGRTMSGGKVGKPTAAREYHRSDWDNEPAVEAIAQMRSLCRWQIIFGGNFYDLPPSSCWLVW